MYRSTCRATVVLNIGIALKSLFKKKNHCASSMSLHWCFSEKYLDYLKNNLPLYYVNVLLFKKRQIYIYVKKKHVGILDSEQKTKDVDLVVFVFHIYEYIYTVYEFCFHVLLKDFLCGYCKCRREPRTNPHCKPSLLCSFQWVWPTRSRLELPHVTLPAAAAAKR